LLASQSGRIITFCHPQYRSARNDIIVALGTDNIAEEATYHGVFVFRLKQDTARNATSPPGGRDLEAAMQSVVDKHSKVIVGFDIAGARFLDVFLKLAKLNEPLEDEIPVCPNCIC
jgi:hypothetical protein